MTCFSMILAVVLSVFMLASLIRWFDEATEAVQNGWWNRVSLLLAVMEKRLGMHLSGQDVYVNVVGGMHIDEPAIDLGIVASVTSSLREVPIEQCGTCLGIWLDSGEYDLIAQREKAEEGWLSRAFKGWLESSKKKEAVARPVRVAFAVA